MTHTAVILAARRERNTTMPLPLQPFTADGQCLMDRHLSMLRRVGYTNIIIVCGYCADKFSRYEAPDVKIVTNHDYASTGSMASLAAASEFLNEDFLLIDSDSLFEFGLYKRITECASNNCFTISPESGNGDEALVETDCGFVTHISKDIHQLCRIDGEMVGLTRIALSTFKRMMHHFVSASNPLVGYEYALMRATRSHERPTLPTGESIWCEVDNEEHFKHMQATSWPMLRRREDPFDLANIEHHVATVFTDHPGMEKRMTVEFVGGMTNRNFKISADGEQWVLRIPGYGTEGMIRRDNEKANTLLSNKMGVSPETRYINPETGIKVTRYIDGAEALTGATLQRFDNLRQVADILSTLHKSTVRLSGEFNIACELKLYEELMNRAGANMYEGYGEMRDKILALTDRLNVLGIRLRPCHNDLVPENFIKSSSSKIYLTDWEYSGMNDPHWDIAALFLECNFSEDAEEQFLNFYFKGQEIPEHTQEKLLIYKVLVDTLWSVWTVVKEAGGDDFGTYGTMRWSRANKNYKKLKEIYD